MMFPIRSMPFLAIAVLFLNGCGGTSGDNSDVKHGFRFDDKGERSHSGRFGGDDNLQDGHSLSFDSHYRGYARCLSGIKTLHDVLSSDSPRYEFTFRCLYGEGTSVSAVNSAIQEQATEEFCPDHFEVTERVQALFGPMKMLVVPVARPKMEIVTNDPASYEQHLSDSPCVNATTYQEQHSSLGVPAWTNVTAK